MMEAIVYQALLGSDKKVTFHDLVKVLTEAYKKENDSRMTPSYRARKTIGGMISNREITICDDGKVIII